MAPLAPKYSHSIIFEPYLHPLVLNIGISSSHITLWKISPKNWFLPQIVLVDKAVFFIVLLQIIMFKMGQLFNRGIWTYILTLEKIIAVWSKQCICETRSRLSKCRIPDLVLLGHQQVRHMVRRFICSFGASLLSTIWKKLVMTTWCDLKCMM